MFLSQFRRVVMSLFLAMTFQHCVTSLYAAAEPATVANSAVSEDSRRQARQVLDLVIPIAKSLPYPPARRGYRVAIAKTLADAGDIPRAKAILEEEQVAAPRDPNEFDETTYLQIAEAQIQIDDLDGAQSTADKLRRGRHAVGLAISIATAKACKGDGNGAKTTVEWIKPSDQRAKAFAVIAAAQAKAGDREDARDTFAKARSYAANVKTEDVRSTTYLAIAEAQTQAGDIDGATSSITDISNPWQKGEAYAFIALAQAKSGDLDGARANLARISDKWQRLRAFVLVVTSCVDAGDFRQAESITEDIPDACQKARALAIIAAAQIAAGDFTGAKSNIASITALHAEATEPDVRRLIAGHKVKASAPLAIALARVGDKECIKDATADIEDIPNDAKKAACVSVAVAQAEIGDVAGAKATASQYPGPLAKTSDIAACLTIGVALKKAGDPSAASKYFQHAKRCAGDVSEDGEYASACQWVSIAAAMLQAGDAADAQICFSSAKYQASQSIAGPDAYAMICTAQVEMGDLDGAMATVAEIKDNSAKVASYIAIAETLLKPKSAMRPAPRELSKTAS